MRPVLPAVLRIVLVAFLTVSSSAILYATVMNERTVESLADRSLESTALALSSATESALRSGGSGKDSEVRMILSDRVVADALIPERDGTMRRVHSEVGGNRKRAAQVLEISLRSCQYRTEGYPV